MGAFAPLGTGYFHCHKADQGARCPPGRGRREEQEGARPHLCGGLKQVRSSLHSRTSGGKRELGSDFFHSRDTFRHQLSNKFGLQFFTGSPSQKGADPPYWPPF